MNRVIVSLCAVVLMLTALPALAGPLEDAAAVRTQWEQAYNAWSVDRLVALYTEDALFFGASPLLFYGRDGVRSYFSYFLRLPTGTIKAKMGEQKVTSIGSTVLLSSGFVDFTRDGKVFPFRMTLVLVKSGDTWLIAQQHASPK
jgi:ketosteroid isomerase-like protein